MSDPTRYRGFVGPRDYYDLKGAQQFNMLTLLGLREHHYLLDIGCGSLRAGRLFIPYLLPGHYYGIEPNDWLVTEGVKRELGEDGAKIKRPTFHSGRDFELTVFGRRFDFLLAHAVFIHVTASEIEQCLSEAAKVMRNESLFLCDFTIADTNSQDTESLYTGRMNTNTHFTVEWVLKAVQRAGLKCWFLNPRVGRVWVLIFRKEPSVDRMMSGCLAAELTDCDTIQKETGHAS